MKYEVNANDIAYLGFSSTDTAKVVGLELSRMNLRYADWELNASEAVEGRISRDVWFAGEIFTSIETKYWGSYTPYRTDGFTDNYKKILEAEAKTHDAPGYYDIPDAEAEKIITSVLHEVLKEKAGHEIERLNRIKTRIENAGAHTVAEAIRLKKNWVGIQNEGGEGYVPHFYTEEDYKENSERLEAWEQFLKEEK